MFQVMTGLTPSRPGLVGISLDLPAAGPRRSDRVRLRHGYLERRSPDTLTVSGPPSPGLDSAVTRMAEDLTAAGLATSAVTRIRVGLEAGLDDESLLGMRHRWAVANAAVPVSNGAEGRPADRARPGRRRRPPPIEA